MTGCQRQVSAVARGRQSGEPGPAPDFQIKEQLLGNSAGRKQNIGSSASHTPRSGPRSGQRDGLSIVPAEPEVIPPTGRGAPIRKGAPAPFQAVPALWHLTSFRSEWETLVGKGFQAASWHWAPEEDWAAPHPHPNPRAGQPDADARAQGQAGGRQGSQILRSTAGLGPRRQPQPCRGVIRETGAPCLKLWAPRPGCPRFRPRPRLQVASLLGPRLCLPTSCLPDTEPAGGGLTFHQRPSPGTPLQDHLSHQPLLP